MQQERRRRQLLFILHRALSDTRNLCGSSHNLQQIFDLADATENIPIHLTNPEIQSFESVLRDLSTYEAKYPIGNRYTTVLRFDWDISEDLA